MSACGDQVQTLESDIEVIKSNESILACREIRIPQEVALTGRFLYYFPQCGSNKNPDGTESLQASINFVKSLGIEVLDEMMDFIKVDPSRQRDGIENYPLIRAAMVFMERGVFQNGSISPSLMSERFGPLQVFQEKMNPYWAANLVIELNNNDKLEELLDIIWPLFQTLDTQSLFAFMRASLEQPELVKATSENLRETFGREDIYNSFKGLLTFEDAFLTKNEERKKCLKNWMDPKIKGSKSSCAFGEAQRRRNGEKVRKSGEERLEEFLDSLTADEKNQIQKLATGFISRFLNLPSEKRRGVLQRFLRGAQQALHSQEGPLRNILALIFNFAGSKDQKFNVPTSDFDLVVRALESLIKDGGPKMFSPMYKKLAASTLHDGMERLILEGGKIEGCEGLVIKPIEDIDEKDIKGFYHHLSTFFTPNDQCRNGLSPLASYFFTILEERVGLNNECHIQREDGQNVEKPCLKQKTLNFVSENLQALNWEEFTDIKTPSSDTLKGFVKDTLLFLRKNIEADEYYLHWLNFAQGSISVDAIDELIKIFEILEVTPESIAYVDSILESSNRYDDKFSEYISEKQFNELRRRFRNVFRNHFLENILSFRVDTLNITLESFQGLIDDVENRDEKM